MRVPARLLRSAPLSLAPAPAVTVSASGARVRFTAIGNQSLVTAGDSIVLGRGSRLPVTVRLAHGGRRR